MQELQDAIDAIRTEQNAPPSDSGDSETYGYFSYVSREVAFSGDSPESDRLDYVVEKGYLPLVGHELRRSPMRQEILETALNSMTTICLSERNSAKIANSGVLKEFVDFVKKFAPDPTSALALTSVTNLALHAVSHKQLKELGILPMAVGFLRFLTSTVNHELDFGLTSASLICRLVGYEESGPGPESIRSNGKLIEKMTWLLREVLDGNNPLGYSWNPANILYDISVLSTSDRNKPLLVDFVELVTRAIELRKTNQRMIRFAIVALSQLYFEPKCRVEFEKVKPRLMAALDEVIETTSVADPDTWRSASVFKASLDEKPRSAAGKDGAVKLRSVVGSLRAGFGGKSSSTASSAAAASGAPAKHVMISYQWDSQPLAKSIDEHLRKAGLKTWFDLTDMGANIIDSMAFAVENAYAIVVLFSRKYKESSNCRKECEMGDLLTKPMVFVKVEPDYKQEGWLGLIIGKALYVDAASSDYCSLITKRVAAAGSVTPLPVATTATAVPRPLSPTTTTTVSGGVEVKEIHSMLKTLVDQFAILQTEVKGIKSELSALREEVKGKLT